MDMTFDGLVDQILDDELGKAAAIIYDGVFTEGGAKTGSENMKSWLTKIEAKLDELYQEKRAAGLFHISRRDIAGQASVATIEWLQNELGIEPEKDTLRMRLGTTFEK